MAVVAQLVRALVCGAGGRGFEPHRPPKETFHVIVEGFFMGSGLSGFGLRASGFEVSAINSK
jgi:hypothetical protein